MLWYTCTGSCLKCPELWQQTIKHLSKSKSNQIYIFTEQTLTLTVCTLSKRLSKLLLHVSGSQNFKLGPFPSLWGDPDPCLTQRSMGSQECSPQTSFWSVQPFLHSEAEMSCVTDRLTDAVNIGQNRLHLMHSMQPNNIKGSSLVSVVPILQHWRNQERFEENPELPWLDVMVHWIA